MRFLYFFLLIFLFQYSNVTAQNNKKHTVKPGESIYVIAKKYNVSEDAIFELNPKAKGTLQPNMVLIIPKTTLSNDAFHEVKSGETFSEIADKYEISQAELKKLNPNLNFRNLQIGTKIALKPEKEKQKETDKKNLDFHEIKKGETLAAIAKEYNIPLEKLKELNSTIDYKSLKVGDKIVLRENKKEIKKQETITKTQTPQDGFFYEVLPKQTLYSIARDFKLPVAEIKKINPNVDFDNLKVGTKIYLPKPTKPVIAKTEEIENKTIETKAQEVVKSEIYHIVQPKETKFGISNQYKISIQELERLNPQITKELKAGTKLVIQTKTLPQTKSLGINKKENTIFEDEDCDIVSDSIIFEKPKIFKDVKPLSIEGLSKADNLIAFASNHIGTRYRSGGTEPGGFDCSGFMMYTYKNAQGISLPHCSSCQATMGNEVSKEQAQKGDLIFFVTRGKGVSHVGMITEVTPTEIKFIHSSTSKGVMISSLNEGYYARRFVKITRILEHNKNDNE